MIQEDNIRYLESQVMDDVPEGGGAATGREIVDGQMNNIFDDISDLDRAYGRFNLRKIFLAVRTLTTELFGGAKTVVTALPTDDAIGYTLFTTNDPFDQRTAAADAVESYLFKGPMWHGCIYENHIAGMRAITVLQDLNTELPPLGKTLCLVQDEGEAGEYAQYIRITDYSVAVGNFVDIDGPYQLWVITANLSDALRYDFVGHQPQRAAFATYGTGARLRNTNVADATRYHGTLPLTQPAAIGDLSVRASSIFTQLVPSAQAETPLVNQIINPELTITQSGGTRSVEIPQQAHTLSRLVTAENRRYNWIETLRPIPAAGAFALSYMAQGNWYTLVDDGAGVIAGNDPALGAGTLDYTTGSMAVTLGALPDVDSIILITYGSPVHYTLRSGTATIADTVVRMAFTLDHTPLDPATLTLAWTQGGVAKSATASLNGAITGDATGTVDDATGEVALAFAALPDRATYITASYSQDVPTDPLQVNAYLTEMVTVGTSMMIPAGINPDSIRAYFQYQPDPSLGFAAQTFAIHGAADGSINLYSQVKGGIHSIPDQVIGSYNATTGEITLSTTALAVRLHQWIPSGDAFVNSGTWQTTDTTAALITGGTASIGYRYGATTPTATSSLHAVDALTFALLPTVTDGAVAGSVEFALGGKTYQDRADGTLYDGTTPAGQMDYTSGTATLTWWADGVAVNRTVGSLLSVYGSWTSVDACLRAIQSPIKPESMQITVTTADGELLIATSDLDGLFTHAYIQGTVDYTTAVAQVTFGQWVLDSGLTAEEKLEWWYDPLNIVGGYIYKPRPVVPATLRYNAVAYSYIPLSVDILGIDPVRLPSDGRVPIFRPGDVALVMHAADTAPITVATNDTVSCGRTRLAWVRLIDALGATISGGYTLDRATGVVTITDATGMTNPITIRHTVADLRLVTDAQITGQLTLARPLSHDFPLGSLVASCLIHGDRRARVSAVWDQASWNGTWEDSYSGTEAIATLDTITYPITVTNEGAETERWVLRWLSTTTVELIGQTRGLVFTGAYSADIAPINPRTKALDGTGGVPYLTIPLAANGGGWSAGNVVRINTVGAVADMWMARAIQQSDEPLDDGADGCEIYALGNIDRP
ncbi:MAG: hypothetical protein OQL08_09190 [Gammaproteobacteria bacterium]|nr:hypothetical protein [Gammaproteobacteria bacterium]